MHYIIITPRRDRSFINILIFICTLLIFVLATSVPGQSLLIELDDHLRAFHVCLPCRNQICLVTSFPLDQEHQFSRRIGGSYDSLGLKASVKSSRSCILSWMKLFSWRFPSICTSFIRSSRTWSFFSFNLSSKALIRSGQSRFSFGSQVFSSGPNPFHEREYSIFPFLTLLSRILSTTNSSPSSSSAMVV